MPTYQYQCKNCGHELEEFQSMTEAPLVRCPNCNTDSLVRVIGAGAGLIFKGTGFYLTDYKKQGEKPEKKGTKKEEKTSETPASTSGDSKSADTKAPEGGSSPPKKD